MVYVRTAAINHRAAAAQRALAALPRKLGWPKHRIKIIEDIGHSGLSQYRPGYHKLTRLIDRGKVGCVVGRDLSRLGRDLSQLHEFCVKARRAGVLILTPQGPLRVRPGARRIDIRRPNRGNR